MFLTSSDKERLLEGSSERKTPTVPRNKEVTEGCTLEAIQVRRQGAGHTGKMYKEQKNYQPRFLYLVHKVAQK